MTAKGIFDNIVICNSISINELLPYSMANLRAVKTKQNKAFWRKITQSQVVAAYTFLKDLDNLPDQNEFDNVNIEHPLEWDPMDSFQIFEHQTEESFRAQQEALRLNISKIDKYIDVNSQDSMTYLKNMVTYGSPGTGKKILIEILVLYCLSKGLNTLSTSLMSVRANALGGIHIHKISFFPVFNNVKLSSLKRAEYAIEKIKRNVLMLHVILTMHILNVNQFASLSAQEVSSIDITMRILRKSHIPFGGLF